MFLTNVNKNVARGHRDIRQVPTLTTIQGKHECLRQPHPYTQYTNTPQKRRSMCSSQTAEELTIMAFNSSRPHAWLRSNTNNRVHFVHKFAYDRSRLTIVAVIRKLDGHGDCYARLLPTVAVYHLQRHVVAVRGRRRHQSEAGFERGAKTTPSRYVGIPILKQCDSMRRKLNRLHSPSLQRANSDQRTRNIRSATSLRWRHMSSNG